jgi:hypothetical protein
LSSAIETSGGQGGGFLSATFNSSRGQGIRFLSDIIKSGDHGRRFLNEILDISGGHGGSFFSAPSIVLQNTEAVS